MIAVKKITRQAELDIASAIRFNVFVEGQGCPQELEFEYDDTSTHFLATVDEVPAGAARWRKTDRGYKLERFAVLDAFRGKGVGQALVKAVLDDLPGEAGYIYLNAQVDAIGLYTRFGFVAEGPRFEEAGIQHYKMVKREPAIL